MTLMATASTPLLSGKQREELALTCGPLEQARSLPPWTYSDPAFYAMEEKYVLRREWLSVGRAAEIPEPGDYFTTELVGEPLIIARGKDGEVRALSAVCRHRGMVVASDRGHAERFICPYHAWTYATDGRLLGAPKMKGNQGFRKQDCRLPEVRTEIWQGWIFVNFDAEAQPLAPRLAALDEILAPYRIGELRAGASLRYDQPFNWKLLPDNWDNYHGLGVHAQSLLTIPGFNPHSEFPWENGDLYAIWRNSVTEDLPLTLVPHPGLPEELRQCFLGIHVFPLHLLLISPEDVLHFKMLPRSADSFQLEVDILVRPDVVGNPDYAQALESRRAFLDYIHQKEDMLALEGCQVGMRSHLSAQGFLSPEEKSQWHFYHYLIGRVLAGLDRDS